MVASLRCAFLAQPLIRLLAVALAALVLIAPFASSAQAIGHFVVIDSIGSPVKIGQEIDFTRPLILRRGEKLSLISHTGFIMTFIGPTTVTAAQAANPHGVKFFDPLRALMEKLEKSGSLRDTGAGGKMLESPWYVDVTRPGPHCILERAPVTVWRDLAGQSQTLVIGPAGTSSAATVQWPRGSELMALGGDVRFDNGGRVIAELEGVVTELTIHIIPRGVTRPVAQAAWMIEKGCEEQAVVIVRGLIGN
jgi:hypothetical protein